MNNESRTILDYEPGTYDAVSHLKINVNKAVEGFQGGTHHSLHIGPSVEFSEHNRYSPGDDIRNIDWKALARTDRYYVKAHEREAQLTCMMLLDCSGSMDYQGTRTKFSKFNFAKVLLGALGHLLVKQGDSVGVLGFSDEQTMALPPQCHPGQLPILLERLANATVKSSSHTDFNLILKKAQQRLGHRGMIVLASDMWRVNTKTEIILKGLVNKGHDVSIFHILSPDELDLPFENTVEFSGLENESKLLIEPGLVRDSYVKAVEQEKERLSVIARQSKIDLVTALTSRAPYEILANFATRRMRGRK